MYKRYLFIGAHVDEEVCFAGTIIKLSEQGHAVDNMAFFLGGSNQQEFEASGKIMGSNPCYWPIVNELPQGIADDLYKSRGMYNYVFTHDTMDRHPKHRMVAEESKRVYNSNLLTYLGPWNGTENSNYFVELTEQQLEKKIQALACYKSQAHRPYMDPDFIRSQARYNGIKCGKKYAEAFRIEKLIA